MEYTEITAADFDALDGVADWRVVLGGVMADFACGSFPAAAALSVGIADAAEGMQHHPDIDIRYPDRVVVTITTHATGGLTDLDVDARPGGVRTGGRNRRVGCLVGAAGGGDRHRHDGRRSDPAVLGGRARLSRTGRCARRSAADRTADLVPADGRAADRSRSVPHRRVGAARRGRTAGCRGDRRRRQRSSPTSSPGRGGCSPTPTVTRPASARGRIADLPPH